MLVNDANSRFLLLKGVATCQNRTAACTARAVWGGHEFVQEEEEVISESHSPRPNNQKWPLCSRFNGRTPQLRAVTDFLRQARARDGKVFKAAENRSDA